MRSIVIQEIMEHLVLMFIRARYPVNFKVENIKDKKYLRSKM